MRRLWFLLLLVAGPAVADPTPDPGVEAPPEPPVSAPKVLTIRGRAWIKSTKDVAIGATVIVSVPDDSTVSFAAISDERGDYQVEVPPGVYEIGRASCRERV